MHQSNLSFWMWDQISDFLETIVLCDASESGNARGRRPVF